MIGVLAGPDERQVAEEFFELFKTPWEFYRKGQSYDVVVVTPESPQPDRIAATLVVAYGGRPTRFDGSDTLLSGLTGGDLSYRGLRLPIYGEAASFRPSGVSFLVREDSGCCAGYFRGREDGWIARVGYDLFMEVRTLLTTGQPLHNASIPTLDLHISLLRDVITGAGLSLIEVPPVPGGHAFIACLTHDVDHPSIRRHWFDRAMFGFLFRATIHSTFEACRGRIDVRTLTSNLGAALRLPFVYFGMAADFWLDFDRYVELEMGRRSTFFVIPRGGDSGKALSGTGKAPRARASGYGASDIASSIRKLATAGCEIGVHGIDAWTDSRSGAEEARQVSDAGASAPEGIRMHWLYRDEHTTSTLEAAGFSYDSTVGYNETVGYRAGTAQAFKPFDTKSLMELPMHVMDTAMFYPGYLNLSAADARGAMEPLIAHVVQNGGVLTVNWHDRSISPERMWRRAYTDLLDELTNRGAWFPTAFDTVSWFRKRRSVVFAGVDDDDGRVRVQASGPSDSDLPPLRMRFYPRRSIREPSVNSRSQSDWIDRNFDGHADLTFTS